MSEHLSSEEITSKKKKKLPFFVVMIIAISGFMLARGVVAAPQNTIVINGATNLFGGDDLAATACDSTITLRRSAEWNNSTKKFEIASIGLSGINQRYSDNSTEGCGNKILNLTVNLGSGTPMQASWTIPSSSSDSSFYFNTSNTNASGSQYADVLLTAFDAYQSGTNSYAILTK